MLLVGFISLAVLTLATGSAVPTDVKCPEFPITENLDLEKWTEGKWYFAATSYNQGWANCNVFQLQLTPEKKETLTTYDKKGQEISFSYPFEYDAEKGKISYPTYEIDGEISSDFINTDYDHRTFYYRCKVQDDGTLNEEAAFRVRESDLENLENIAEDLKKVLSEAGSKIADIETLTVKCPN